MNKEEKLKEILFKNKDIKRILKVLDDLKIENCYLTAGAISATVFNYLHNYKINKNIKDYDIVYFDPDTSYEKEDMIIKKIENKLKDLKIKLDIKNQARVNLWYKKEKYGKDKKPYKTVEDAIKTWRFTCSSIGVRLENNNFVLYAPYGLDDLFNMIIRPVKIYITKQEYDEKASKWKSNWPLLKILPFDK